MITCRSCIGVLLTNLTLESELRIKSHLQKLLTVAKNLFSHLGKNYCYNTNKSDERISFVCECKIFVCECLEVMNGVVGDVTVLLRQIMAEARHLTQVIQQIFLVCSLHFVCIINIIFYLNPKSSETLKQKYFLSFSFLRL